MKKLLALLGLLVANCGEPMFAGEVQQETRAVRGNLYNLKAEPDGTYLLEVLNGWTCCEVMPPLELELELDGFAITIVYTYTLNKNLVTNQPLPPEDAADMVDVLKVPDGWIAWPAYQSVSEDERAVIRIIPNLMG